MTQDTPIQAREVEAEYRIKKIKELAANQLEDMNYPVSQWELDIFKLGVRACYDVTRVATLEHKIENQSTKLSELRAQLKVTQDQRDILWSRLEPDVQRNHMSPEKMTAKAIELSTLPKAKGGGNGLD